MLIADLAAELRRYKIIAEKAMVQVPDDALNHVPSPEGNSMAMVVRHLSGNLKSRFTDFLTTDGEKPWRNKKDEFSPREARREELLARWNDGWNTLFQSLGALSDSALTPVVNIVGKPHRVDEALDPSLSHARHLRAEAAVFWCSGQPLADRSQAAGRYPAPGPAP